VESEIAQPDLANAIKVYQATRSLVFANIPAVDMKDRLSVLTVASGLRRVGVLETWGQRLPQTRERMIANGLATSVANCVWSRIDRPAETPHRAVLEALDERRVAGKPKHVLWLYATSAEREQYRQTTFTQQQAGALLGYPSCCIAFESTVMDLLPRAQLDTLIGRVGQHDDATLIQALRGKTELAAPKIPLPDNALRTEKLYPFALHVACDACLDDNDSPSASINQRYGDLAMQVDAGFHALFLAVQETYCQVSGDQQKNRDLLLGIRTMHAKFFRGVA
jgi:hypothetical protein